jgi:hypothetical protein
MAFCFVLFAKPFTSSMLVIHQSTKENEQVSSWDIEGQNTPLSILKTEETYSDAEIAEEIEHARAYLRRCLRRFLYSIVGFTLCCTIIVPFLAGHSLHAHWDKIGKYFLFVAMGVWLAVVISGGMLWSGWKYVRDLEKAR